ncbi:MAG: primosomal protein N' [Alphaproteobacteria bacterium]|jgi:primosomal protein N' (replication factor Y)|nr:primosomal protein N' [Alphaproteobacteria bacterium]MDP6237669.1 primosomal protein N' [Alphaproteobacteria bacterium]MDP7172696.1 primosomal protein N' [Alphaproteobacteria bacterium]|tara:strand:+ start:4539 stop:6716 length:2178 start_codon:yes stop_codon:yes gene_type:complete
MTTSAASVATVRVLLPLPLVGTYDYRLPETLGVVPGSFVSVPLGPRSVTGVVWREGAGDVVAEKLRDIESVLSAPPMGKPLRDLVDWVAGYTLATRGTVLRMAMSVPAALEPPRLETVLRRSGREPDRLTPQRTAVLLVLGEGAMIASALARAAGVRVGVVRGLVKAGALLPEQRRSESRWQRPDHTRAGPALSPPQAAAAEALVADVVERRFSTFLLDGVTGSGKTEVYFEAIAAALAAGRQALVLLPEIGLGAQWLARFAARFGAQPAQWHSDLGQTTRRDTWRAVAEGEVKVVVGARSALFLPFPDLGVIVVDEEHDASYKQDEGVTYNARDMAVVRAHFESVPLVLASATPALETVHNVERGRYRRLLLPDRHGVAELPDIAAVDLRRTPPSRGHWLSPPLVEGLTETLARGEQALLFLNRRGYAPLTLCRSCGHRLECPNCSAWLVEHRLTRELRCHHCDQRIALPEECPSCGTSDSLAACGPGIERLAEEMATRFPDARLAIMASDTVHGPEAAATLIDSVTAGEVDILVGTQMVTKGHHFPALTLVGVVDADLGLAGGDLRAAERTFQLLFQVAGRAGRAERAGRVLVQTTAPEHPVMRALVAADRDSFIASEMAERRAAGMPPFGRLAAIIVSSTDAEAARASAAALRRAAPDTKGISVLGPAPAPLSLIRGRYRFRLLISGGVSPPLQPYLTCWLGAVKVPSRVRVQVDIDPYGFL